MALDYGVAGNLTARLMGPYARGGDISVKMTEVTIYGDAWKNAQSPYTQVVEVEGISVNSMVTLHPDEAQLAMLFERGIALFAENEEGVVTVYAVGGFPEEDMTFAATIVGVIA